MDAGKVKHSIYRLCCKWHFQTSARIFCARDALINYSLLPFKRGRRKIFEMYLRKQGRYCNSLYWRYWNYYHRAFTQELWWCKIYFLHSVKKRWRLHSKTLRNMGLSRQVLISDMQLIMAEAQINEVITPENISHAEGKQIVSTIAGFMSSYAKKSETTSYGGRIINSNA